MEFLLGRVICIKACSNSILIIIHKFLFILLILFLLWHSRLRRVNTRKMNDMVNFNLIPTYDIDMVEMENL